MSVKLSPIGEVSVEGEFWSSEIESGEDDPLDVGTAVQVVGVEGNKLKVKPVLPELDEDQIPVDGQR